MLVDPGTIANGDTLEADVCIAGAGPAGITIARRLASAGIRVILLDSGGEEPRGSAATFVAGTSTGLPYYPLEEARARAYGGSSHLWAPHQGWRARPLDEDDFRPHAWVPGSGWPVDFAELRPHLDRAQEAIGLDPLPAVGGIGDEPAAPPLAQVRGPFRTAGLPFAQPDSFVRTHDDLVADENIQLLLGATLVEIYQGARGRVSSFEMAVSDNRRFRVTASHFVLALGGIDNARTMLMAGGGRGVGNEHDQVGRNFMEHCVMRVGAVRPHDPAKLEALSRYRRQSPNPPPGMDRRIVIDEERRRDQELLAAAFMLTPVSARRLSPGVRAVTRIRRGHRFVPRRWFDAHLVAQALAGVGDVARYAVQRARPVKAPHDVLEMQIFAEQVPNQRSRVALSRSLDHLGAPRARLHWQITDQDRRSIVRSTQILAEAIRDAGLADVEVLVDEPAPGFAPDGQYHHLGTTRMSRDPRHGVVDSDCRVHSLENLFVAGTSVFPTGGWANPTLTMVALADRLGAHLAAPHGAGSTVDETGRSVAV